VSCLRKQDRYRLANDLTFLRWHMDVGCQQRGRWTEDGKGGFRGDRCGTFPGPTTAHVGCGWSEILQRRKKILDRTMIPPENIQKSPPHRIHPCAALPDRSLGSCHPSSLKNIFRWPMVASLSFKSRDCCGLPNVVVMIDPPQSPSECRQVLAAGTMFKQVCTSTLQKT
jgi:hypothetical protein